MSLGRAKPAVRVVLHVVHGVFPVEAVTLRPQLRQLTAPQPRGALGASIWRRDWHRPARGLLCGVMFALGVCLFVCLCMYVCVRRHMQNICWLHVELCGAEFSHVCRSCG
jgi:hypothetical protein